MSSTVIWKGESYTVENCPLCGGEASIDGFHDAYSCDSSFEYVGCTSCELMLETNDFDMLNVIKTWNTRQSKTN